MSEIRALDRLVKVRADFADEVRDGFEHAAQSCRTCSTPGACCLDEHFVNVRISRLEAVAIGTALGKLTPEKQLEVASRTDDAIEKFGLDREADAATRTFACPLFEKGVGCLVHSTAKPLPCIQHACYDREADMPPDQLLDNAEAAVDELNRRTYGSPQPFLSLPTAIKRFWDLARRT